MPLSSRVGLSLLSLLLPGEAHGQIGRRNPALAWAIGGAVTLLAAAFSIWMLFATIVIRVGCMVVSFAQLGRVEPARGAPHGWGAQPAIVVTVIGVVAGGASSLMLRNFKAPSSSMVPTVEIGDHLLVSRAAYWFGAPRPGDVIVFDMPCEPGRQYLKRIIATGGQHVEVRCGVVYVDDKPLPATLVAAATHYDDYNETSSEWYARDCSAYDETAGDRTYRIYDELDRPKGGPSRMKDFPRLEGSHVPPSCESDSELHRPAASGQLPGTIVESKANAGPCELQLHYVVPADHVFVMGDNRGNSNDSRFWGSVPTSMIIGRVLGVYYAAHAGWGHVGPVR